MAPSEAPPSAFRTSCDDQHIADLSAPVGPRRARDKSVRFLFLEGVTMSNPKHISSLIGEIYDAILDRTQGTEALGKAAQFVGAQAGALLWRNPVCRAANVIYAFGIEPRYVDLYTQHYAKLDPTTAPMLL